MDRHSWLLVAAPLLLAAAALGACAAPVPDASAAPPTAPDTDFPNPFVEAGPWQDVEFVDLPGARPLPSLDAALADVRTYFLAGIKTQAADNGVTMIQTGADPKTRTVSLLVTAIGGANEAVAGRQFRVLVHQDEQGWWVDPQGSGRVYCLRPLGGIGGTSCVTP